MASSASDNEPEPAEISATGTALGWRYIHGIVHILQTNVRVSSLAQAAAVAKQVVAACPGLDTSLRLDIRADRVVLTLESPSGRTITDHEVALVRPITDAVRAAGLVTDPQVQVAGGRSAQFLEIAFDAMDIPLVRPFWKAILGYQDEPGEDRHRGALTDPAGELPTVWFQQMDAPRPQRNRIHLDISVPHDEAEHRVGAALAAGGHLVSGADAPAYWVLADAEGNEACVTTWRGAED